MLMTPREESIQLVMHVQVFGAFKSSTSSHHMSPARGWDITSMLVPFNWYLLSRKICRLLIQDTKHARACAQTPTQTHTHTHARHQLPKRHHTVSSPGRFLMFRQSCMTTICRLCLCMQAMQPSRSASSIYLQLQTPHIPYCTRRGLHQQIRAILLQNTWPCHQDSQTEAAD